MAKENNAIKSWIVANGEAELVAQPRFSNSAQELTQHQIEHHDVVARLAFAMVEKWGMIAAEIDGEDSAGRTRLRLTTPSELVDRAVTTAETLVAALRQKGHVTKGPTFAETQDVIKDR